MSVPHLPERYPETCPRCRGWVWHRSEPCACESPPAPDAEKREVYLAAAEEKAMGALADAWNAVTDALGPCDPSCTAEAAQHIHALQRMILANVAARAFPEKYRTDR